MPKFIIKTRKENIDKLKDMKVVSGKLVVRHNKKNYKIEIEEPIKSYVKIEGSEVEIINREANVKFYTKK